MSTDLQPIVDAETVARVLLHGDLKQLSSAQKVSYYRAVCESVGLNPLTQPFQYLVLNGKEILYARREATEQLRQLHKVSIQIMAREVSEDCYVVTARATLPDGRTDENIGAVPLGGLKGEARANAMMKAETKSKRRVTLAICGLGLLDESEVESLPPGALAQTPPAARTSAAVSVPAAATGETRGTPYTEPLTAEVTTEEERRPADTLPPGYVLVQHVNSGPTKNPNITKYFITLSTGEELQTINNWIASLAEQYRDDATPVRVKTRPSKHGTDLIALMTQREAETPREPVPTDDDMPF